MTQQPRLISATIITYQEADNIADCIRSVQSVCDDIVVVDSYSDDQTCSIATQMGARVFLQKYLGDGPQRNIAGQYAHHDWLLSIDADERLEQDAIDFLRTVQLHRTDIAYAFRRRNLVGDHWLRASGFYPNVRTRLYNKQHTRFNDEKKHTRLLKRGHVVTTKVHIRHLTYRNYQHWMARIGEMSTRDARIIFEQGRRVKKYTPAVHAFWSFLRQFIFLGGIFHGNDGLTIAFTTMIRTYMKYLICYEMQKREQQKSSSHKNTQ